MPDYSWDIVSQDTTPAVIWNPMISLSAISSKLFDGQRRVLLDLLDDWTLHYAFRSLRNSVIKAYQLAFEKADVITANSEGTVDLANRFGRTDVLLVPNGCDPGKFDTTSRATGSMTLGYIGKIGRRVNLKLIEAVSKELPSLQLVFVGPILDREYIARLRKLTNVHLLGDVHYNAIPDLLTTFDIGWVPHNVGAMEVGGDVIKTYEYRAAGLPVLTTPVIGAGTRNLEEIYVRDWSEHVGWLAKQALHGPRVPRKPQVMPDELTWEAKARFIVHQLGIGRATPH